MNQIEKGDWIITPNYGLQPIGFVIDFAEAQREGFLVPTGYDNDDYEVFGKHIVHNRMVFAAVRKEL